MTTYTILTSVTAHRARVASPSPGTHWARLGDQTLVWSEAAALGAGRAAAGQLYLVTQVGRAFQDAYPTARTVLDKGRYLVVDLTSEELPHVADGDEHCWAVRALPVDTVILDNLVPVARAAVPWVAQLTQAVSPQAYESDLRHLASFPTRHSHSAYFVEAARWARDELRALGFHAELSEITVGSGTSFNVVADLAGSSGQGQPRDVVLVTAHLDSINIAGGPAAPAPGADDNGSGSAAVLEIGRVLATHRARHDLRLILFGGEEEGLHGSTQYVAALPPSERARIRGVVNMDMIGTLNTTTPTVLLEGAAVSQHLIDRLAAAAATYTSLAVQTSLNPFASDHVPFINAAMPAVLTIEGNDSANGNVHSANDTLDHIHYPLAVDIIRMNVATVATLLDIAEPSGQRRPVPPAVVARGPGRIDVLTASGSALHHQWWDGETWKR